MTTALRKMLGRLRRDRRGMTLVEMGFVALPLSMTLLALTDLGYRAYLDALVEGTLSRAARQATIGNKTSAEIDSFITAELNEFAPAAEVAITKRNYYDFTGIGLGEKYTDGTTSSSYIAGKCYYDLNNDGLYTTAAGREGLGGSDDIVYYAVNVTYPRLVPLGGFLGWGDHQTITANTIVRNQPFGAQAIPRVRGGSEGQSGNGTGCT